MKRSAICFDLGRAVEDGLNLLRQRLHRRRDFASLHHRHFPQTRELECEQRERDDLACECLRRRNADLRAGVQIDAAVIFAGDRRADDVHQAERFRAAPLRFAHRGERVGRLARL